MIQIEPIGYVRAAARDRENDLWGGTESRIELTEAFGPEALVGLEAFSHVEVLFHFHEADPAKTVRGARHPRHNPDWPAVGIFAQRGKDRPNALGATIVRVLGREGRTLRVAELDALDGTPVLDLKPVLREFLPREAVTQPAWATELMTDYWAEP